VLTVRTLRHEQEITRVSFSPDGTLLATACRDTTVRLWSTTTGRVEKQLDGHVESVHELAFSPDRKTLATASGRGTVHLWDVASHKELRRLTGHKNWVGSLVFSKTGKELISGSVDDTLRLWDVATGKEIRRLEIPNESVNSLALSPDGTTVAVGYFQKKTIRRVFSSSVARICQPTVRSSTCRSAKKEKEPDRGALGRKVSGPESIGAAFDRIARASIAIGNAGAGKSAGKPPEERSASRLLVDGSFFPIVICTLPGSFAGHLCGFLRRVQAMENCTHVYCTGPGTGCKRNGWMPFVVGRRATLSHLVLPRHPVS
jgi:dipeptidyl aminopeptidase/acylaminoacyl peptidase